MPSRARSRGGGPRRRATREAEEGAQRGGGGNAHFASAAVGGEQRLEVLFAFFDVPFVEHPAQLFAGAVEEGLFFLGELEFGNSLHENLESGFHFFFLFGKTVQYRFPFEEPFPVFNQWLGRFRFR